MLLSRPAVPAGFLYNFHVERIPAFDRLAALYREHGYNLYLVGGTSRDILLGLYPDDLDACTDATVEEAVAFLPIGVDLSFQRFGRVKMGKEDGKMEITTLREEGPYLDHRHPSYLKFIKDLKTDSLRRDFTVNAIYLGADYVPIDFHGGLKDLEKRLIKTIGDPYLRFQEDPLRIPRAERLAARLGFSIEQKTMEALKTCYPLLAELNPAKLKEEERKGWTWPKSIKR